MTLTVIKTSFKKQKPSLKLWKIQQFYNSDILQEQFLTKLNHTNVSKKGNILKVFQEARLTVLNSTAPRKFIRANQVLSTSKKINRPSRSDQT